MGGQLWTSRSRGVRCLPSLASRLVMCLSLWPPLGPARLSMQPNVDAIDDAVPSPGVNSTDGLIVFAGLLSSVQACEAACLAWPAPQVRRGLVFALQARHTGRAPTSDNPPTPQALLECQAFTYTGPGGGAWAQTCYLRLGFGYITTAVPPALTVTSGRRSTQFLRAFAHAAVDVDLVTGEATITWGL